MNHIIKRYKPEIIASGLLILYTLIRTLIVAYGISPVSQVSWQMFLAIEIITTFPYVWAMGDIIRRSWDSGQTVSVSALRKVVVSSLAAISLLAPYAYLSFFGALNNVQGIVIFIGLLAIFTIPSIIRFFRKLYHS